ncbi:MAG TPA: class I SAM-dependent methyltransferase [Solirubrobacteraceae bacterium]|nr:class I SAM-dependent methyltransferase [Solirubrobacteraceae bacterium]
MDHVIWHDVECGSYAADFAFWRGLAADRPDPAAPVLDLGAGTGRVALDLASVGVTVHALDFDGVLLDALRERADAARVGERIVTHESDARDFALGAHRFDLILAPMQTVQLLGGADGRARLLASVRKHLTPGGLFAAAIAHHIDAFDEDAFVPVPDVREIDGVVYASRPTAIREDTEGYVLERLRERVDTDGGRTVSEDRTRLDRLTAAAFEEEARRAGFTVELRATIGETSDHVGSEVAMLRA